MKICAADAAVANPDFDVGWCEGFGGEGCVC